MVIGICGIVPQRKNTTSLQTSRVSNRKGSVLSRRGSDRSITTRDSGVRKNSVVYQKSIVLDPITAVPCPVPMLCTVVIGTYTTKCNRTIGDRSEEHTTELQSLLRQSHDVLCLKT